MTIEHYMMFGTFAEQRHFVYPNENTYDGVIFNANVVAYAPKGLAAFLVSRTKRLSFYIDPLTHAFQHSPTFVQKVDGSGVTKKAIVTLADKYGEPTRSRVGVTPVEPSDFNEENIPLFTRNCLLFQRESITAKILTHEDAKYFSQEELNEFAPKALIAPYFYITEYDYSLWLSLNIALCESALECKLDSESVYAEIVLDRSILLDNSLIDDLSKRYNDTEVAGYFLWVDSFDEHKASIPELLGFLKLCRALRSTNRPLINLHGSYFSILMAGSLGSGALTGVTHGPEFGESRAVVPVGGGLPFAKYYLPVFHGRVAYRDMIAILIAKKWDASINVFYNNVCNCDACKEVLDGKVENFVRFGESSPLERGTRSGGYVRIDYPTIDARLRCLKHYLQRKAIEFQFAAGQPSAIVDDLDRGITELQTVVGRDGVSHLYNWKKALGVS